jgi:hypothetical protein
MQPNNPSKPPRPSGGYVPYFYESGLFENRPIPGRAPPVQATVGSYASYDFSSEQRTWSRTNEPQTVEQVIASGYFAVPPGEPETALISDKKQTSWLGLDDVIGQIRDRYEIYQRNIFELEQAKCEAANSMHRIEADRGSMPANSRERYSVDKGIQDLYQQQRDERVNLWRDVSRIRITLPETAQNYLAAHRKVAILEDSGGDGP